MGYAAGTLEETFATVVAAHLSSCVECRMRLRQIEAAGGALLESIEAVPMKPDTVAVALGRLEAASQESRDVSRRPRYEAGLPRPLARMLEGGLDDVSWRRVAPGIDMHRLPTSGGNRGTLTLLKIAPGRKIPEHGHGGTEMTLVLSGSYRDAFGRFGPGDVADLDEDVEHQPVVDSLEPCVCLVATEAPTRFKGVLGRLLQPFTGI
jgi:putative transcriptional regulator